jgi:arylsulfatase A-like enzyme
MYFQFFDARPASIACLSTLTYKGHRMSSYKPASRRTFLQSAALVSSAAVVNAVIAPAEVTAVSSSPSRPNVLMICADQFRADFLGANRENPSVITPHLDALARRGTNFQFAVCNQPLCSPSRASFLTSRYATETDVWKLEVELNHSLPTIATEFRKAGYTSNFLGKWHVSDRDNAKGQHQFGWLPPGPTRGGFDDVWEGANILELISHPTEGNYWLSDGTDLGFRDEYRVDFIADRAVKFIEVQNEKPWFLFVSQLEPHQQNDMDAFVPPERYSKSYPNPFVPEDLRNLPGDWRAQLPGYYGCVQAIDDCVGKLVDALQRSGQFDNTIICFFSDHGCTFRTRLGEYKRSPHDSSLRVPFVIAGPGFNRAQTISQLVSLLDLTPTLLDGAGVQVPASMKGHALKQLLDTPAMRQAWDDVAYIQISSSICGRAMRTADWTYCCYDPTASKGEKEFSTTYTDFALYSNAADPYQQVNLAGRPQYAKIADDLRKRLRDIIIANGEPAPTITAAEFYA